ncbi:MAG TPA: hypothetical protein VN228_06660 [Pyrinomonadaceae bacterium]|nr:hypothetical protein [Pyrinomonadaceae bacterium]
MTELHIRGVSETYPDGAQARKDAQIRAEDAEVSTRFKGRI